MSAPQHTSPFSPLSAVNSVAWAPHEFGLHLAAASSDGKVSILSHREEDDAWDVTVIEDCPVGTNAVSWAPAVPAADGGATSVRRVATAGCDGNVRVYRGRPEAGERWAVEAVLSRAPAAGSLASKEWARDVAWCPAGLMAAGPDPAAALLLASCSDDGFVCLWRPPQQQAPAGANAQWSLTTLPQFPSPVWRTSWSVTGRLLAVSCGDNSVTLWKEDLNGVWQQVSNVPVVR